MADSHENCEDQESQTNEMCCGCKNETNHVFPVIIDGKITDNCLCDSCRKLIWSTKSNISCTNCGICADFSGCIACLSGKTGLPLGKKVCNACGRKEKNANDICNRHGAPDCCNSCHAFFSTNFQKALLCENDFACTIIQGKRGENADENGVSVTKCKCCKLQRCKKVGMRKEHVAILNSASDIPKDLEDGLKQTSQKEPSKRPNDANTFSSEPPAKITPPRADNVVGQPSNNGTLPDQSAHVDGLSVDLNNPTIVSNVNSDIAMDMNDEIEQCFQNGPDKRLNETNQLLSGPPAEMTPACEMVGSTDNAGGQASNDQNFPEQNADMDDHISDIDTLDSDIPADFNGVLPSVKKIMEADPALATFISKFHGNDKAENRFLFLKTKVYEMYNRALECLEKGDHEAALLLCTKGINVYPDSTGYSLRSLAYLIGKKYEDATKDAGHAILLDPSIGVSELAYHTKIVALRSLERYDEMTGCVEKYFQEFPGDENFFYCIFRASNFLMVAKKWKMCYDFLEEQLKRFPKSEHVRGCLENARDMILLHSEQVNVEPEEPLPGTSADIVEDVQDVLINKALCNMEKSAGKIMVEGLLESNKIYYFYL